MRSLLRRAGTHAPSLRSVLLLLLCHCVCCSALVTVLLSVSLVHRSARHCSLAPLVPLASAPVSGPLLPLSLQLMSATALQPAAGSASSAPASASTATAHEAAECAVGAAHALDECSHSTDDSDEEQLPALQHVLQRCDEQPLTQSQHAEAERFFRRVLAHTGTLEQLYDRVFDDAPAIAYDIDWFAYDAPYSEQQLQNLSLADCNFRLGDRPVAKGIEASSHPMAAPAARTSVSWTFSTVPASSSFALPSSPVAHQ